MRACIVLAYLEDRTVIEIAASLSCSPKTVENQLREGRRRLRVALSQEDTHV
jgi:DNA-directed RNA polymerase specialized sigma24 family protein